MADDVLIPLTFPADAEAWPAAVAGMLEHHLASAARLRAELASRRDAPVTDDVDRERVLLLWDEIGRHLRDAGAFALLFANVHPDPEVRALCEDGQQRLSALTTEVEQDADVQAILAAVPVEGLDPASRWLLEVALRDFRRAGVDRDEATRERVRQLLERIAELGQSFDRTIREDVRSVRVAPDRLTGLPQDWLDAHPADENGLVTLTTDYPDLVPVRTFARDADLRRDLVVAWMQRGWPDNQETLAALLAARDELARLLGAPDWPDHDAQVTMIGSGAAIASFIDRTAELATDRAQADVAQLEERLRRDEGEDAELTFADLDYVTQVLARELYDVDAHEVRRFLAFEKVKPGVLNITSRLLGIQWVPVPDAPVWHEDVEAYDVRRDGRPAGRIYLDLHPRADKYAHAATFDLVNGAQDRSLPEGVLVCNFPRGLMEHSQVVTFFHEFGHLVHHVLAGQGRYVRQSGVATEWDFVEAPSQMLERWAWDADVLASFATDEDGRPIPAELVARMREADGLARGLFVRRQMALAAISYWMHARPAADLDAQRAELQERYDPVPMPPDTHIHTSFGHLSSYSSAYYTYMWSLVIAADLFSAFDPADLLAPEVAHHYRDRVLAPGGSRPAAELVEDFLGRPFSDDAFRAWLAPTEDALA